MMPRVELPVNVLVSDVARATRESIDAFVVLPRTMLALGAWLAGPYRHAVSFAPQSVDAITHQEEVRALDQSGVAELIRNAQDVVRQAFVTSLDAESDALVRALPRLMKLVKVRDVSRAFGFAAVDSPRMSLGDRMLTLIMAEYLTEPEVFLETAERRSRLGTIDTDAWVNDAFRSSIRCS